jgi:hypothetical protein
MWNMFKRYPTLDHPIIQLVTKYVCGELNVSIGHLRVGDRRNRMLTTARHIIWYVLYDIGVCSYTEISHLFIMDRAGVVEGAATIRSIVKTPLAICGKGRLYTPERKRLVTRLVVNARAMAVAARSKPAAAFNRETITIPARRIDLDEMDNLAMTDLATRFSGGWLVELSEFARDPSRYPELLREPLGQEKESKFVWVIPTSYAKPSESTTDAPSEDATTRSPPTTTADKAKAPTTLPETPKQLSTTAISKLQMQSV